MIVILFLLTLLPSVCRLYSKNSLKERAFGFCEDLFIASQQIALLWLIGPPFICIIALLQVVYIIDSFFYRKMEIRFNLSFFRFLKTPNLFLDSAIAMGVIPWLFSALILSITTYFTLSLFPIESPPFLLILSPLLLLAYKKVSKNGHNILLLLEGQLFFRSSSQIKIATIPETLLPKCELATSVDPIRYPLLKMTEGFTGPRQFSFSGNLPKHIIFIFLESFRAKNVGILGAKIGVTPHFDALAQKGIFFSQFYANGILTKDAMWASLTGVPPLFHPSSEDTLWSSSLKTLDDLPAITLATLLHKEGYHNLFIDGSSTSFDKFGPFLKNHHFDEIIGKEEITSHSPIRWGVHDEYLFAKAANKLAEFKGERLFTCIATISNHDPWKIPNHYSPPSFAEVSPPLYQNFLQTMHYTDHCLHNFIQELEKQNLLKESLLFILGDHGMHMVERSEPPGKRNLYEEGIHVPLLIYAEGRIRSPLVISDPGSQIDLLPTVMDLLSIKGINHSVGTSLVRKQSNRTLFFGAPLYLGNASALRCGDDKFHKDPLLFNLKNDPSEHIALQNSLKTESYQNEL
ncbi:MAG: LTA synthase family protein, partial [Chlamydiae bacterium]|nr:LTA synthase family protein [Chlamydiota bacterium]